MRQTTRYRDEVRLSGRGGCISISTSLWKVAATFICSTLIFSITAIRLSAREKDGIQYGMGLIVNIPFTESEVSQVLQDVVQDGIIRGTKEYNKDEYVSDAAAVSSTKVFPAWTGEGKVFYKVRLKALDPRNFKDSGDVGTLAVRYVVQAQGDKNSVLHINAVFVEDFRRVSHPSNGSVEGAEYKDIHDRLDALESIKEQTAESLKEKAEYLAMTQHIPVDAQKVYGQPTGSSSSRAEGRSDAATGEAMPSEAVPSEDKPAEPRTPEERLKYLRHQVERLVKSPGAPLKSAPFHTATTLQTLGSGTEVLIVVMTPYWLGVETHDGQHGWILRDQLEQLP